MMWLGIIGVLVVIVAALISGSVYTTVANNLLGRLTGIATISVSVLALITWLLVIREIIDVPK